MTELKKTKITYWVSTGILAVFIIPGIFFLNSKMALDGTAHLGLPLWFHWELGIAKFIGGIILIVPFFPKRLKEWTYVAFGIDFISAFIAILAVDGAGGMWYSPIVVFIILLVSYSSYHKLNP
ncbi:DoxX family protein [Pedobacter antarcticus]|uniref:DoxX family protein n=1 Tax=Pedobacter antarcticus TaxID=34086 RepID=UPI001C594EBC|nr:DoxX family protein [Pedobacter antarcticus]